MRAVGALVLVILLATAAGAQVKIKGDAAAWREVMTAHQNLAKLKTYRMKMTAVGQPDAFVIEKVNPNRSRMKMQTQGVSMETIVVGKETRTRMTGAPGMPAGWQCQSAQPQAGPTGAVPDPAKAKGAIEIKRLPDTTIDGARVRGYQYTMRSEGPVVQSRLFVLADRGLPRRMQVLDQAGKVQSTTDYYDYNAPITIDLPKCG